MKLKFKIVLLLPCFFFSFSILAANSLDIVINEIAWMGTKTSANDEWIELSNKTSRNINLEGWLLKAKDGSPEIELKGKISAKGFYLLERTDDESIPYLEADQIYKGSLENRGEDLELYDNLGNLIDKVDCRSGWFAGNNKTKQTMERKIPLFAGNNPDNWQTSQVAGGTPRAENSQLTEPLAKVEPQPLPETEEKTYPSGIVINEILPSPEGPDTENEWIELFNQNNFEVDISGWQIVDEVGSVKIFTIPEKTKIPAKGFLVFVRPITKIILNNSADSLKLIQPNSKILDRVTFEKAPKGESYNFTEAGWFWSPILTPGSENILPEAVEPEKPESQLDPEKVSQEPSKVLDSQNSTNKGSLATIKESFPQEDLFPFSSQLSNFWAILLIGLLIATFSGVIFLLIKKKIKRRRLF
jgi:hypothetical protein